MKYKCRLVSEQFRVREWGDFEVDGILYSAKISLSEADALLVLYDPSEELLTFQGPKIWFTIEPSWHHHFHQHPIGKQLMKNLDQSEHVFYGNPDPRYRIAHPTYRGPLTLSRVAEAKPAVVACVNNFGGRTWFLKRHIRLRNQMILCPQVELFGRPDSWSQFRHFPKLWIRRPPANFQGRSSPGNGYYDDEHMRFLSGYKVAVCLENCVEPHYFTEKFVNAARAGCIPVYHAHPTVREKFLKGARWVDPADFEFSPRRTIEHALAQDQAEFRRMNDAWLKSEILANTDDRNYFGKLRNMILQKLTVKNSGQVVIA